MRHAEKARNSSCRFADEVATRCIAKYLSTVPPDLRESYKQTVLSGIVLQGPDEGVLEVISLGVGTKVLPLEQLLGEKAKSRVRDLHAEVLARRGLLRWLHIQLELASGDESPYLTAVDGDVDPGLLMTTSRRYRLRPQLTLHMYSSSQPCGNACIKAWAKCKKPTMLVSLGQYTCPSEPHPVFRASAVKEGQIAALVKRAAMGVGAEAEAESDDDSMVKATTEPVQVRRCPPAATAYPELDSSDKLPSGVILTCSDKLCVWNCLGLQGALLSARLEPLYLRSFTVGRKFSQVHCHRALCCRAASFASACGRFATHHPTMMCTSVCFDTSVIPTASAAEVETEVEAVVGADFSEKRCFVWALGAGEGEVLDGSSGFCVGGQVSSFSSSALERDLRGLSPEERREEKRERAASYCTAKSKLFSSPFFLDEYSTFRKRLESLTSRPEKDRAV